MLEQMVCLRLHFDDSTEHNGPLLVIDGSHTSGVLNAASIARRTTETIATPLTARRGDVLAFKPLLLHSSASAKRPGRRRVLQLELCAVPLPAPLRWRWAVVP